MADKIRIKVILRRVHVLDDADNVGSGEFYFKATVDGQAVGNRQVFDAVEGRAIVLPQPVWSAIVDVTNKTEVVVSFQGKDEDTFSDDDLGSVKYTLRKPWEQEELYLRTKYFILDWGVEVELDGSFGRHAPDEVYACREHNGSLSCTTVSGVVIPARLEFHPVRPLPPAANLPPRPPLPAGTPERKVENLVAPNIITPASDINILANPPVIPIMTAAEATAQTVANIEFTYYRPDTLKFTDKDPRLEWSVVPVSGGAAVSFLGAPRGLKVQVYGTTAGEVRFEVRFRGALFATYRALVLPIRKVACRFNILNGPTALSQPLSTPTDVQNHLAIVNRLLRQMALELVLDTDPTRKNFATATTIPGIFRIRVPAAVTRQINGNANNLSATILNYRPGVMNFAYIHSDRGGARGVATDYPHSPLAAPAAPPAPPSPAVAPALAGRPVLSDSGTPSDSWELPSGIKPDAAAGTKNLYLIMGFPRAGHPNLFAMYITNRCGDPVIDQQQYARTISHEFCHTMNLGHRVEHANAADPTGLASGGIHWDGLNHPPNENVMRSGTGPRSQDFDILQAQAARRSKLLNP